MNPQQPKAGQQLSSMYNSLIMSLIQNGTQVSPHGRATREMLGVAVTVNDIRDNVIQIPERKLNYHFMVAEALWVLMGRDDVAMLAHYNNNIAQFSDDGKTFAGAYGPRIKYQLPRIIEALTKQPDTRQAVISIWDRMPAPGTKDVPCTVSMQFLVRDQALSLIVYMRSSDAWWGLPYDIFTFTSIQSALAYELKVKPGRFLLWLASSHIYETHVEAALRMYAHTDPKTWGTYLSPQLPGFPPESITAHERKARLLGIPPPEKTALDPEWCDYLELLAHRKAQDDSTLIGNPIGELYLQMKERRHDKT